MSSERLIRRAAAIVLAAVTAILVLFTAHVTLGMPAPAVLDPVWSWSIEAGSALVLLLRAFSGRGERAAWAVLSLGCASFLGGDLYYSLVLAHQSAVTFPSLADALYLGFYVACLLALVLLIRSRVWRFSPSVWIDALIGSLSVASFGVALVLPAVLAHTGGDMKTVVTNLTFPLADLVLLSVVVATIALLRWRLGRGFTLITAALCLFALTDSIYLYRTALGTYHQGTLLDVGWEAALVVLGFAAWQPARRVSAKIDGWTTLMAPLVLGALGLALTVYDHFARVDTVALLLGASAVGAVLLRLALTFAEHLRTLARSQSEALTDVLTGLGNRRALMRRLEDAAAHADLTEPALLVLFDLDGFKSYNDRFGHPAGDALLRRLGRALQSAVEPAGSAFRLGGDEFCLLARPVPAEVDAFIDRAGDALSEHGEGFDIRASYGGVLLPIDARDSESALREADRRLYAQKTSGRASAGSQSSAVLLRALEAHHPELGHSLDNVTTLAGRVARELGLSPEAVVETQRAARLHDIGKVGIPAAILRKPGRLTAEERGYMERHTLMGQHILDAAPALASAGLLVRSSHEHWDGNGYPDQLAGTDIPVGARIILACDAYDAMTSDRPYRRAISPHAALGEVVRCAGSQFDPRIVHALQTVLQAGEARRVPAAA
jgi:two-component system cell cycle response regulator